MAKITVVGAGRVGSTVAQLLAYKGLGDVVLWNRTPETAKGIALDLMESAAIEGFDFGVAGTGNYRDTKGSDVVIITAGAQRKPGMSRDDLLQTNSRIVKAAAKSLARHSPRAVMIVVTNPLDIMVYSAWKSSGLRKRKVVGMAGALDSSRMSYFVSRELGVLPKDVRSLVLGGHGDFMLPIPQYGKVSWKPLEKMLSIQAIKKAAKRTVNAGAEIIRLQGSSAFYAPASSVARMVESIIKDKKWILPCSAYLDGEYGIDGVFLGVPVRLGRKGVEDIIEVDLTPAQAKRLEESARKIKQMIWEMEG